MDNVVKAKRAASIDNNMLLKFKIKVDKASAGVILHPVYGGPAGPIQVAAPYAVKIALDKFIWQAHKQYGQSPV